MKMSFESFIDWVRQSPDVPEGDIFHAWRLRALEPAAFESLGTSPERLSDAQLAYFAWFNLLAPTSHNTVPQRFRYERENNSLLVYLDRRFVLSASDPTGRQALVSIGCGIENTIVAARFFGWREEVVVEPVRPDQVKPANDGEPRYTLVARIRFERTGRRQGELADLEAMLQRKVVRAEYDAGFKLDERLVARIHETIAAHPGLAGYLLTDAPTLLFLGKFQELADTTVFNREAFALELGEWLVPNDSRSPLGMRGAEFGLNDEVAQRLHDGLLRRRQLLPDEMAGFAKAGNLGMRSSSAVAVITVDEDSVAARIAAGRAYEAVALHLQRAGLATAMHAGITEVEAPNLALRGRLRTRTRPTVVFRIGRPLHAHDGGRPHSARPSLAAVTLADGTF